MVLHAPRMFRSVLHAERLHTYSGLDGHVPCISGIRFASGSHGGQCCSIELTVVLRCRMKKGEDTKI